VTVEKQKLDRPANPSQARGLPWGEFGLWLSAIQAPVVVLLGSDTKPFFRVSARHVTDRVANGRIQEISGAGHAAPLTHPEVLAAALTEIFSPAQQPA
jgi:pimeloyl-ACP methyl ester carboxylesterase